MEAKETDKLFRDKLKGAPSQPKADSWEKLDAMLDNREKVPFFTLWRVAAAVLILLVSGMVLFFSNKDNSVEDQLAVIEVPSESMQDNNEIVPERVEEVEDEQEVELKSLPEEKELKTEAKAKTIEQIKTPVKVDIEQTLPVEVNETPIVNETQLAEAESISPEMEEQPKKKIKSIKITYKRGKVPEPKQEELLAKQETDTTGGNKIKELWNQTREIKPGDLWADIREAKDNLFQRNSKKNNAKNLNK
ncbi:MAG: hypothetical protein ABJO02_05015 [Reichenbachiella sp.]|uniref:hypothetical protein n=1 Tax=Reichenbachiella sp. TaxID=2184521 RepID=UPI003296CE34